MPVVRDLIATVNRLAHVVPPAGTVEPSTADPPDPERYADAGIEPPFEEVLEDPIIRLLMRADRIEPADLRHLLHAGGVPPSTPADIARAGDRT